ncbi:SseB family protein [Isoptericola sp. b441]|uniref:SseB family protein n=1 Tax=Actinotalea lenta TaxID=3064654 RepID=A0ABT9D973_9CELL|nr:MULTISPECIES: SseB family protein [unclassified Isoptericola]MDO8107447.1 SseB family protein [Isoptericola sp. b441]MDO8120891.1 SseB family protein [Isoptericola sp. b490]
MSAFAADDGSAAPAVAAVLAEHAAGRADTADVVAALRGTRVLVPVVAHERDAADDRHVDTAVVAVQAPDGRTAMPVFTSVAALSAWNPAVRPMPAELERAAISALAEGWPLLVIDPGGPVTVPVPRPAVQAIAAGLAWHPAVRDGEVRSDVSVAVQRALATVADVRSVEVEPGRTSEVAVVVGLPHGLDRGGLEAVLARIDAALAADPVVAQIDTLELRPVAVG